MDEVSQWTPMGIQITITIMENWHIGGCCQTSVRI